MQTMSWMAALAALVLFCMPALAASTEQEDKPKSSGVKKQKVKQYAQDRSGKVRKGKASFYGGKRFAGKKMADGTPMNPNANIAASKTLPLGTKAKVTNLENNKSQVVEIRDRGPYVEGRIVDVSPKVAKDLDMKKDGVAPVAVQPLEVPKSEGGNSSGSGASGSK